MNVYTKISNFDTDALFAPLAELAILKTKEIHHFVMHYVLRILHESIHC